MAMRDEVDTGRLAMLTIVGSLVVVLVVLVVKVLYHHIEKQLHVERNVKRTPRALQQYHAEQQEKLNRFAWVDRDAQAVAIPIDLAMQLTLRELKAQQAESTPTQASEPDASPPTDRSVPAQGAAPNAGATPVATEQPKQL